MFGVTLSFVATRSGLLKWTEHKTDAEPTSEPHFSEVYQRAFDAPWYKRAVDHHAIEPESFVFSVPFKEAGAPGSPEPLVLATHAVFIEHRGHRAPAGVVGLYYELKTLAKHFVNITSTCTGPSSCKKNCASLDLDCYILDDNGFVILSEETGHTGQFFGQIDGTIMDSLVQDRIYKKVPLFDYQGRCPNGKNPYSASGNKLSPTKPMNWLLNWVWKLGFSWFSLWDTMGVEAHSFALDDISYPVYNDYDEAEDAYTSVGDIPPVIVSPELSGSVGMGATTTGPWIPGAGVGPGTPGSVPPAGPPSPSLPPGAATGIRQCDKRTDLYVLQADRLNMSQPLKGKLTNCHVTGCERPFSVQKIPHSNLILLVVDTLCPCGAKQLGTGARELPPTGPCRIPNSLFRRRPHKCINYHPEEIEIQLCGGSNSVTFSMHLLFISLVIFLVT